MNKKKDKNSFECCAYRVICSRNKRAYYGLSINLRASEHSHFLSLRSGDHHCEAMQKDFTKYGEQSFKFEVIKHTDNYISASIIEVDAIMIAMNKKEPVYNYIEKIPKITTASIAFRRENLEALKQYAEMTNQSVSRIMNSLAQRLLLGEITS